MSSELVTVVGGIALISIMDGSMLRESSRALAGVAQVLSMKYRVLSINIIWSMNLIFLLNTKYIILNTKSLELRYR
jgi:hypothetical protein